MEDNNKLHNAVQNALASFTDTAKTDSQKDLPSGTDKEKPVVIPSSCWLDVGKDFKAIVWSLRVNGVGMAPVGDIQILRGMEGNGKSFLFTIYIATVLRGELGCLSCDIPNAKVLLVDTEQSEDNVLKVARRVHHLCGWRAKEANERFRIMRLREIEDLKERQDYLWQAIEEFRPDVVFLDGLSDLIGNINDYKESTEFVHKRMVMASKYNMAFWSILHVNYGSDKMRGHAGTEEAHKCSDVVACEKVKEGGETYFKVQQVKARNKDVDDFTFIINDDENSLGIPQITTIADPNADTPTNRGERDILMKEILGKGLLSKRAIIDEIIKRRFVAGSDSSKEKAKVWFEQSVQWNIIEYNDHKRQYQYVGLNADPLSPSGPIQTELPY